MDTELLLLLASGEAGEGALDNKRRYAAARAFGLIGHGKDNIDICHAAIGDKDLRAV